MTVLARSILFVSSYAPLLVLFAMLKSFGPGWPSHLCLIAAAVSVASLGVLLVVLRTTLPAEEARFVGARSRDSDVMAYVVSYVVPFAAATDSTDKPTRWALAIFAALIAVLYVRSAVYYVHPLLLLAGIHVYEATREGVPVIILTRQRDLRQNAGLRVINVDTNIYLEKRK